MWLGHSYAPFVREFVSQAVSAARSSYAVVCHHVRRYGIVAKEDKSYFVRLGRGGVDQTQAGRTHGDVAGKKGQKGGGGGPQCPAWKTGDGKRIGVVMQRVYPRPVAN